MKFAPGGPDKVAVYSPMEHRWGVCHIVYTKSSQPETVVRCATCQNNYCCHCTDLKKQLESTNKSFEMSPLEIFREQLEIEPSMREYFEIAALSTKKIPVYRANRKGLSSTCFFNWGTPSHVVTSIGLTNIYVNSLWVSFFVVIVIVTFHLRPQCFV